MALFNRDRETSLWLVEEGLLKKESLLAKQPWPLCVKSTLNNKNRIPNMYFAGYISSLFFLHIDIYCNTATYIDIHLHVYIYIHK